MSALPTEIHVEVLRQLRPLLESAEYFLDLRRINRTYNEAILHELLVDPSFCFKCLEQTEQPVSYQCFVTPHLACDKNRYGVIPRLRLNVAQIAVQSARSSSIGRGEWVSCLKEAMVILRQVSHASTIQGAPARQNVTQSQIQLRSIDLEAYIFNLVIESALQHLYLVAQLQQHLGQGIHLVQLHSPTFWAVNAACYSASQPLLEIMLHRKFLNPHDLRDSLTLTAALTCLPTVIARGQSDIATFIVNQYLAEDSCISWHDSYRSVVAAIGVRDDKLIKSLLETCNLRQHLYLDLDYILRSFSILPLIQGEEDEFSNILMALLPYIRPESQTLRSKLTTATAYLGIAADIHLLADNRLLGSLDVYMDNPDGYRTALGTAAGAGKLDVIEALLDKHYLAGIGNSRIRTAVIDAVQKTLEAGHTHVYMVLRKRFERVINAMYEDFELLSRLDGAEIAELMRDKLDSQDLPKRFLRQCASVRYLWSNETTLGATALYLSIHNLRWQNVDMLLSLGLSLRKNHILKIPWIDYSRRQDAYERTRNILRVYDAQVELEIMY